VIRLIELEICTKTLQNFSQKLSSSYLFYAFSEFLLPERSLVEGQNLQQKETKKEKGKAKK